MRKKRTYLLKYECRPCGLRWEKRKQNGAANSYKPARCPSCGARDTINHPGNALCRDIYLSFRRQRAEHYRRKRPKPATPATPWRTVYEAYMESPAWREIRGLVIARDGGACRACGAGEGLHVHHIHYKSLGREDGRELITLCLGCHRLEHSLGSLREREHVWHKKLDPVRGDAFDASLHQGPHVLSIGAIPEGTSVAPPR